MPDRLDLGPPPAVSADDLVRAGWRHPYASAAAWRRAAGRGAIPPECVTRVGRKLLFRVEAVRAWLTAQGSPLPEETQRKVREGARRGGLARAQRVCMQRGTAT